MSDRPSAEKDVCDGCQKRPCVCETVVLPNAENGLLPIEECIDPTALIDAMVQAGAWAVIEASMDTADREPSPGLYEQTCADVRAWLTAKLREAAMLGRRATNDPGAFVKRGPDYDGNAYGERLDQWQNRAIEAALATVIPPGGGMPDPASLTPEESARWAEALDGRPRVLPPGEGD